MKRAAIFAALISLSASASANAPPPVPSAPAASPAVPSPADPAAVSEPNGYVRSLYEGYYAALTKQDKTGGDLPKEWQWNGIANRFFTAELATRFKKAEASEEPVIDWDFLINGQDFGDLKVISVDTQTTDKDSSGGKAVVKIVTSNFSTQSTTLVSLVKEKDAWRIADFTLVDPAIGDMTLTGILKDAGY